MNKGYDLNKETINLMEKFLNGTQYILKSEEFLLAGYLYDYIVNHNEQSYNKFIQRFAHLSSEQKRKVMQYSYIFIQNKKEKVKKKGIDKYE